MTMRSLLLVSAAIVAMATAASGCGGGGGGALDCPAAPQTCNTAIDLGEIIGDDENTVPLTRAGTGSAFVSALVREVSFDNRSISVRGTIASIDQTTYDLLLYVPADSTVSACGRPPIASSNNVVDANWPDTYDGSSQDRKVVFQVRPRSGTCGGGWILIIEGNTTSVTSP
jgi:hypothetical protein